MSEKIFNFAFKGTNSKGKTISGVVVERNEGAARTFLLNQNINIKSIRKQSDFAILSGRIKSIDIAILFRQLAVMMRAGIPLIQSLQLINGSINKIGMKRIVTQVKADIESGLSFDEALSRHPRVFDHLTCSLVRAGENSGTLDGMLLRIADYKEKSELTKAKVKKALKYPLTVLLVALVVTVILLLKVIPVFKDLFESFGSELPAYTQMVVSLSDFIKEDGIFLLIGIIAIIFGLKHFYNRSPRFRNSLAEYSLRIPVFGSLIYMAIIARFSRTLATTFAAGVPLSESLINAGQATANVVYEEAVEEIRSDVVNGQSLFFAMRNSARFPDMAIQMTSIGEESGKLDEMLDKVASHYESEVDNAVDGITAMLEPLIMAVLGVLVGGLVIAMYLPIFQMGAVA